MTIERQWFEIMKIEVPDAFQDRLPDHFVQKEKAGFIDGQIKLMGMVSEYDWNVFLSRQFVQPIQKMLEMNASVVVLAFDDYEHVPRAKSMTQAKRRKNLDPFPFVLGDSFPSKPPEPWDAAMANRVFKASVVQWIIDQLDTALIFSHGVTIVIDWRGQKCMHWFLRDGILVKEELARNQTGEADIKFLQWSKKLQMPMIVDAIDGDFVPIALASKCSEIFIWRYKVLKEVGQGIAYEWVDIDSLRAGMNRAFQLMNLKHDVATWPGWELDCLLTLIGLTGTDYTRGLPWVGPKKVWTIVPSILPTLVLTCLDTSSGFAKVQPEHTASKLYGLIYANVFCNHVKNQGAALPCVLRELGSSKLSIKTKNMLPSYERAFCTAKNINFLLAYWNDLSPDSLAEEFGYRERGDTVEWDD